MTTFSVIAAEEDAAAFEEFFDGQRECYARFGADSAAVRPESGSHTYLITARGTDGKLLGGMRVHRRPPGGYLPAEIALASLPDVVAGIRARGPNVAELCGLWVTASARGSGLSVMLVQAAAAIAPRLGIDVLMSFGHQHNWFIDLVGMVPDESLGRHPYPDERYASRIHWGEPASMPTAPEVSRQHIKKMRRALASTGAYAWDPTTCPVMALARRVYEGARA